MDLTIIDTRSGVRCLCKSCKPTNLKLHSCIVQMLKWVYNLHTSSIEVDSEVAYEVFPGICFLVVVMLQSCCARLTLETLTCRAGFDQTMTNVSYLSRLSISFFFLKTLARVLAQRHPLYRCIHQILKERKKTSIWEPSSRLIRTDTIAAAFL